MQESEPNIGRKKVCVGVCEQESKRTIKRGVGERKIERGREIEVDR